MRFQIGQRTYVFVHIPRTAGTYIEQALCKKLNIHLRWPTVNKKHLFGLARHTDTHYYTLQHLTYQEMQRTGLVAHNTTPAITFFAVVRNPFERVYSLYRHWGGAKRFTTFNRFLRQLDALNLDAYAHCGIVPTQPALFNHRTMTKHLADCTYHFLPQYVYLCNADGTVPVTVYKMEDMASLNALFGVSLAYRKRSTIPKAEWTSANVALIVRLYAKDFEHFGYARTPPSG